jgi:hypothetical protein
MDYRSYNLALWGGRGGGGQRGLFAHNSTQETRYAVVGTIGAKPGLGGTWLVEYHSMVEFLLKYGNRMPVVYSLYHCSQSNTVVLSLIKYIHTELSVFGIRNILVRIQIPGSVSLTNGPGSGSNSRSDSFLKN